MAKRANGQGAVYLRGDGRWDAQLRLAGGGRKSVNGRTRREVLGKLREMRWAAARGLPVSSRNPTLAVFLDRWLEVIRDRLAPVPTRTTSSMLAVSSGLWIGASGSPQTTCDPDHLSAASPPRPNCLPRFASESGPSSRADPGLPVGPRVAKPGRPHLPAPHPETGDDDAQR